MSLFSTTITNLVNIILPPKLRPPDSNPAISYVYYWIAALVVGLQTNMTAQLAFTNNLLNRARFNGQKIVLEAALNYLMATTGIKIAPSTATSFRLYLYNEVENLPEFTYNEAEPIAPLFLFNESETVSTDDFTILVPVAFYTSAIGDQITAYANQYKLAGKKFSIATY